MNQSIRRAQLRDALQFFNPHTPQYRAEMLAKWHRATLTRNVDAEVKSIVKYKPLYDVVSKDTHVPWWAIGIFDMRESGFNHRAHLVNGDPINKVTTHVPKGIGPFFEPNAWSKGAIFAMHYSKVVITDLIGGLIEIERYNGEGYHNHVDPSAPNMPCPSPYDWAGTNIYHVGKYRADGVWDSHLVDKQQGAAAILKRMIQMGVDLGVDVKI